MEWEALEGLETYFDNYNEWGAKIIAQCREQMPGLDWRVKRFSITLTVDWDDGPPMFYVFVFKGDCVRRIDLSAEFLAWGWDHAIEMCMEAGRVLLRKEE